jgi:hypothetical protein
MNQGTYLRDIPTKELTLPSGKKLTLHGLGNVGFVEVFHSLPAFTPERIQAVKDATEGENIDPALLADMLKEAQQPLRIQAKLIEVCTEPRITREEQERMPPQDFVVLLTEVMDIVDLDGMMEQLRPLLESRTAS